MAEQRKAALVRVVDDPDFTLYLGDTREVLAALPPESVDCCVTSPPYWGLRDYGNEDQIGLEESPEAYIASLVAIFREVRRVLRPAGTLWLNLGDSYAGGGCGARDPERWPKQSRNDHMPTHHKARSGLKDKDLVMIPAEVALALRADGWWLRSDIVWHKPNPMPESVTDRPTKAHEYVFLLSKSARYFYAADAIAEPASYYGPNGQPKAGPHAGQMRGRAGLVRAGEEGLTRNARTVWTIQTQQFADAHFATFPEELPRRCILAGSPEGGVVLDPFLGSGTTAFVARSLGRKAVGIELNPEYAELASRRLAQQSLLAEEAVA